MLQQKLTILIPLLLPLLNHALAAQETILGAYIFHRHGDRTAKATPPANLTDLGYVEVYDSGTYYRNRYISSNATRMIHGISNDLASPSTGQIMVSAPLDVVLQNSATGFLQGLYPPVGDKLGTETLHNGTKSTSPMNGYQLIPVDVVESGTSSESSGWLQDSTLCNNAETSSNEYFSSHNYNMLLQSTQNLYQHIEPVIHRTFNSSEANYFNAYEIWDLINVALIHNHTISHRELITEEVFHQLFTLANVHEFYLAYNSSSTVRAIAGMQLAGEIVSFLNDTIESQGVNKIGIQFGSYGTFQSFFGLAELPSADGKFYGIPEYASSMSFELYTTSDTSSGFPSNDDLKVRFYFHNGTASTDSEPEVFPLFGQNKMSLSWNEFVQNMGMFSVESTEKWCHVCGNTTGTCAPYSGTVTSSSSKASQEQSGSGSGGSVISNAVAGVIGAMVTLAVILLVEGAILLFGGVSLVRRKRLLQARQTANGGSSGGEK